LAISAISNSDLRGNRIMFMSNSALTYTLVCSVGKETHSYTERTVLLKNLAEYRCENNFVWTST